MTTDREKPTVSVVIPAYNAEKTIERLLNCVLAALKYMTELLS